MKNSKPEPEEVKAGKDDTKGKDDGKEEGEINEEKKVFCRLVICKNLKYFMLMQGLKRFFFIKTCFG